MVSKSLVIGAIALAAFCSACDKSDIDGQSDITELALVTQPGSFVPRLVGAPDGNVILSWLAPDGDASALRYSVLKNERWSPPVTVASGDDWFVNWADFPSVVPMTDDLWAAHWLVRQPEGTYQYNVAASISRDGGQNWGAPITPHTDATFSEHGFVSLYPWKGGVGALWLDGRNTTSESDPEDPANIAGMTLRSAVLLDTGEITDSRLADDLVCDCCQTDVALGQSGPIAVYRNRTVEEVRDIYITREIDGQWETGRPVANDNWEITGCPVNGPSIAANGNEVVVAWFTAAESIPKVRFARSSDGAISFADAIDVATDKPLGRVGVVLLENGDALVTWLRNGAAGSAEILVRRVSSSGFAAKALVVATTSAGRQSGFPQLVRYGDNIVFAWTDISDDKSTTLRTAMIKAVDLPGAN